MKWNMVSMGDIALREGGSIDPKKHQDEVFELYSIAAFDAGAPEVVVGSAIGSSKKLSSERRDAFAYRSAHPSGVCCWASRRKSSDRIERMDHFQRRTHLAEIFAMADCRGRLSLGFHADSLGRWRVAAQS